MVSKKNKKISPKDINLLLNKLIIIIKKFSNSYGNKKKRVSGGLFGKSDKPKDLNNEIHDFLSNNFIKSQAFFKNFTTDYFKTRDFKEFFSKNNITLKKDNFHNQSKSMIIQYNKEDSETIQYIKDNDSDIRAAFLKPTPLYRKEIRKNIFILCFDDKPALPDSKTGDIGYIIFENVNSSVIDRYMYECYSYYKLNKKLFSNINNGTAYKISEEDIKTIKKYIQLIGDKTQSEDIENYQIQDTLETFYYYMDSIRKIDVSKNEIIDIYFLIKSQEKCGKTDKYILKHAVIYNIGIMLKSLQNILNN
jgi:hypothetical protein